MLITVITKAGGFGLMAVGASMIAEAFNRNFFDGIASVLYILGENIVGCISSLKTTLSGCFKKPGEKHSSPASIQTFDGDIELINLTNTFNQQKSFIDRQNLGYTLTTQKRPLSINIGGG
jgi:hypothetical protein